LVIASPLSGYGLERRTGSVTGVLGFHMIGNGAPAATRTRDPRLRRPVRYPTELRAPPLFLLYGVERQPSGVDVAVFTT
jgi:hypothetical protein